MKFADHLRSWPADALQQLLLARPDLLAAADNGFEALARQARSSASIGRCLVRSDVAMLVVADALAVMAPTTVDEIDELLGTSDVTAVAEAVERLRDRGLVVVQDGLIAPVGELALLLPYPLGLSHSLVELWPEIPDETADTVSELLAVGRARTVDLQARAVARAMREPSTVARLLADAPDGTDHTLDALVDQRMVPVERALAALPPEHRRPDQ